MLLYGPPASGKDTITRELTRGDGRYRLFPRVKCGPGRTTGYRMVTADQLAAIRATPGEVLWENHRYGAVYVIDRSHLAAMVNADLVPVLHLGQTDAVNAVTSGFPSARMLVVALTCPRGVAIQRMADRATGDTEARLAAYDATSALSGADLNLDTSGLMPAAAAALIDQAVKFR